MSKIVPGILTNEEKEYEKKLRLAEHVSDLIQIDVIDGKFANNVTVGVDVITRYPTSSSLEVQMMTVETAPYIEKLKDLDFVSRIIVPFEATSSLSEAIYQVKSCSKQVGVSLNLDTAVFNLEPFFDEINLVLLMAGTPGFSGQKFDERALDKIKEVKKMGSGIAVEVDIGVNYETTPRIVEAGADFLVASSALFNTPDFYVAYESLDKLASKDR